jgi:hypothetical protein
MLMGMEQQEKLRGENLEDYKIFVAYDLTQEISKEKLQFYEKIGEVCEKAGYRAFLPHRVLGIGYEGTASPEDVYLTCSKGIAYADLIIAYVGIISTDVGVMIAMAERWGKDIIYLYEKGAKLDFDPRRGLGPLSLPPFAVIEFDKEEEALKLLEEKIKDYFNNRKS